MKETIGALLRKPWIAHIIAAVDRFLKRLGPQFSGSITYFSILSVIPVLLLALAVLGFVVTVFRPDLLLQVQSILQDQLGVEEITQRADEDTQDFAKQITDFVTDSFTGWRAFGPPSFIVAAYSGSRWVKHLKHAVRAMWRDSFAEAAARGSFVGELFGNLIIFLGLLLSIAIAAAVTAAGQAFPQQIISWLGVEDVPGIGSLVRLVSVAVSLVSSWMLLAFLFIVLPGERTPPRTFIKGTLAGAVLLTALQQLAALLVGIFSDNTSAGIIGPIIVVMLVFNVLATIILMIAAWVGTAETWEADRVKKQARAAAGMAEEDETGIDETAGDQQELSGLTASTLAARRRAERWAADIDPDSLRGVNYDPAKVTVEDPEATVKQKVAARSVRAGMVLGYGVGAATGVGLGAVIAALAGKIFRH